MSSLSEFPARFHEVETDLDHQLQEELGFDLNVQPPKHFSMRVLVGLGVKDCNGVERKEDGLMI